jgi:glutathione peroxidase
MRRAERVDVFTPASRRTAYSLVQIGTEPRVSKMRKYIAAILIVIAAILIVSVAPFARAEENQCSAYLSHEVRKLRSSERINLCDEFGGKPMLIVNTASRCGFTPQFAGLEALHQQYKDQGLAVLGVPSNDFNQAAKDEEAAARICYVNYGVTFTMLSQQRVRGPDAHPLFRELSRNAGPPDWNFNKYLVDRDGKVIERFDSMVDPMSTSMRAAVESVL